MKITKEKIINLVKDIPTAANKEKWVLTLDREEGVLFYAPKRIPNKAELFQVTDEFAVYLDKAFKPRGVIIECYGVNFVKHHPAFEVVTEKVFGEDGKKIETINPQTTKNSEVVVFKALLETTLVSDAVKDKLVALK